MKPEDLVSEELANIAKELDVKLEGIAGKRMGFSLLVWNEEKDGHMNYVSNSSRDIVKLVLTELLKKWDTDEGPPSHEFQ